MANRPSWADVAPMRHDERHDIRIAITRSWRDEAAKAWRLRGKEGFFAAVTAMGGADRQVSGGES